MNPHSQLSRTRKPDHPKPAGANHNPNCPQNKATCMNPKQTRIPKPKPQTLKMMGNHIHSFPMFPVVCCLEVDWKHCPICIHLGVVIVMQDVDMCWNRGESTGSQDHVPVFRSSLFTDDPQNSWFQWNQWIIAEIQWNSWIHSWIFMDFSWDFHRISMIIPMVGRLSPIPGGSPGHPSSQPWQRGGHQMPHP